MDAKELQDELLDAIREYQAERNVPLDALTENTRPVLDLHDFDSMNGVELTCKLQERLGINDLGDNVCLDRTGKRALRIKEIAKQLCEFTIKDKSNGKK